MLTLLFCDNFLVSSVLLDEYPGMDAISLMENTRSSDAVGSVATLATQLFVHSLKTPISESYRGKSLYYKGNMYLPGASLGSQQLIHSNDRDPEYDEPNHTPA